MTKHDLMTETSMLGWRVHTPNLLKEVVQNDACKVMKIPFTIFQSLLTQVAERARELDDKRLNELMIRLTLYSVADPASEDFDQKVIDRYLKQQ